MSLSSQSKEIDRALEIRRELMHEIKHGKLSRRAMHRKLLMTGGALAALGALRGERAMAQTAGTVDTASGMGIAPRTRPFIEELVHVNRPGHVKAAERLMPEPTRRWARCGTTTTATTTPRRTCTGAWRAFT